MSAIFLPEGGLRTRELGMARPRISSSQDIGFDAKTNAILIPRDFISLLMVTAARFREQGKKVNSPSSISLSLRLRL